MAVVEAFLEQLREDPFDSSLRGILMDYLEEKGCGELLKRAKKEVTLEGLNSYDWQEAFGEGSGVNTGKKTDVCPAYSFDVDSSEPSISDVEEVLAAVEGENDEESWLGIFRLKDGRYLFVDAWCDYTGWDCQAGNSLEVANTLTDILRHGTSATQLLRLFN